MKVAYLFILILLVSCSQQQARKPITQSSGTFIKESIERNKKLVNSEETIIDSIIKADKDHQYISSKKGFWYCYQTKNETDTLRPKKGDIAEFEYNVTDIYGTEIYSTEELGKQNYRVDKEDIMVGLRQGIKLMHKNEEIKFIFPSTIAYGYFGDKNKIGVNVPIICTISMIDFKPETASKPKTKPKAKDTLKP